jgi:hypothetical protein
MQDRLRTLGVLMVWCGRMESEKSLCLYMQRVVSFVYAMSCRLFSNLTDMLQKPLACFGLCMGMVPKAYQRWYNLGTIPTCRPMQAEAFRCISVKLCKSRWLPAYKKLTTLYTYKVNDIMLSILRHQTLTMPGVLGLSRLLLSLPLVPMLPPHLWSSLRSFPIPWPCLLLSHCKSSFHILFYIAYYRLLTVALLICCLIVIS